MKKIFLTTIALLSMASASVFGMYGVNSGDWIGFLTHGNQFRARMQQLGFTLGNDTIKGTFGFFNNGRGAYGSMLSQSTATGEAGTGLYYDFTPTISMGLAYTSSLISVGVGYNATIGPRWDRYNNKTTPKKVEAVVHTPVLVLNALDNAFRMAIPIQVVNLTDKFDGVGKGSITAVSLDAQFRYFTGLDFLPQIRLLIKYGNYGMQLSPEGGQKEKVTIAESFGFEFRLYFGAMVEEVAIQPIVKLAYNGALGKQHNNTSVTALGALEDSVTVASAISSAFTGGTRGAGGLTSTYAGSPSWKKGAWNLTLAPALGITANSDIVSLYVEPSLGLKITQLGSATDNKVKETYGLAWGTYAEIYITPIKNLEWYFEADVGGATAPAQPTVNLAASTGITWYLPAL
ncbi:cell surface protein [Brachyspira aalborgi]|uniref:Cell surface protein n=1 Tax=Brachyspira aalborgi TaxID=29522 RepID=A0A5C8FNR3_9SPIR|nr:cell surface protein [Brachyspira aalborgi]TXJ51231.1 cell surface protein [Brachyspira aalborgi]